MTAKQLTDAELATLREIAAMAPALRDVARIAALLPAMLELASNHVAQRQTAIEYGRQGGQKSGERRRGDREVGPAKGGSTAETKGGSIAKTGETKGGSRISAKNGTKLDSDSGIGTNPPSPPWKRSPLIENKSVGGSDPEEKKLTESGLHKGNATSPEARFDSRRRAGRPDTGLEHEKLAIGVFHERFKAEYGAKPNWTDGNAKSMRGLVSRHGSSEVIRRVGIMFDSPPTWLSPPYDMRTFVRFFDKFVAPTSAPKMIGASGLTYGRFEPSATTDYRAPWVIEAERKEREAEIARGKS